VVKVSLRIWSDSRKFGIYQKELQNTTFGLAKADFLMQQNSKNLHKFEHFLEAF
jgi:hypothetical protein